MKKIMLVDNNYDYNFFIKNSLEKKYKDLYEVIVMENGVKCLNYLQNNAIPDIILLEINMDDMSGWEIYSKLKDNPLWRNIPIIFFTIRSDRIAENAGVFLGEDYIQKPIEIEKLVERINNVID
jgi:response regulator RpfG family c-di-GMP phosphodiesterase